MIKWYLILPWKRGECQKIVHERGYYFKRTKYPIIFKRLESTRTTNSDFSAIESDIGSDQQIWEFFRRRTERVRTSIGSNRQKSENARVHVRVIAVLFWICLLITILENWK
ncbi:uncharacterized protein [Blastocystis hominis]|uniref:Uncharacterized protein n=1 Tax=Blastocystis hominis TaxID=12968 RepID=D8LX24_BLAHO|nr:uncharacterized protein [Blastocystis hominis]CBK20819.2 unnamed protein product [Blastocystis hominis]|eukprot:XP_012894867.1 uncharacterized protein [Blastocystis hominis]